MSTKTILNNKFIKEYLPKSHSLLNSQHKDLFGQKIYTDEKEKEFYLSKIENLDLDVFIIKDNEPNAFTIPGTDNITLLKHDLMDYQQIGLQILAKHPLSATINKKTGKIVFSHPIKNFKILVFLHSGLFKHIPNIEYRFAIVLHEIGHWVYVSEIIENTKLYDLIDNKIINSSYLFYPIKLAILAFFNVKSRKSEFHADSFVKQVGYGKELQHALSLLRYKKEFTDIDNIKDEKTFFDNLKHFIFSSHPSMKERLEQLSIVDNMINKNNGTICKLIPY